MRTVFSSFFLLAKMEMLIARLEKERAEVREKIKIEMEVQQEQLQNMEAAHMGQAEQEREAFIKENHALEERFLEMQKSNEENMKMIKNMSELIAKHEAEKMKLRTQTKTNWLPGKNMRFLQTVLLASSLNEHLTQIQ